jgi:2,3-diketo-5-methylthio-1-phosphopentane phosphatase
MHHNLFVYCDFDGTVSQCDTVDFLLERLGKPGWQEIEAAWQRGDIGSRACMSQQIPLIQGGWPAILDALSEVKLDPTFKAFAQWCGANRIPLYIVSDGLDRVIRHLLSRENIIVNGIFANHLLEQKDGSLQLAFPHARPDCDAGLCKCTILNTSMHRPIKVVIGDGMSDLCWSQKADWLFAKVDTRLQRFCDQKHLSYRPFEHFETIQMALSKFLSSTKAKPALAPAPAAAVLTPQKESAHVLPIGLSQRQAAQQQ